MLDSVGEGASLRLPDEASFPEAVSGRGPRAGRGYRGHAAQQSRMLDRASCAILGALARPRRRCA